RTQAHPDVRPAMRSTAASEPCATCSSHGLLEEVGHALLCPLAIAWSYTHVPTARSRIPMPKGAKMIGRPRFTVVIRSLMSAGGKLIAKAVPARKPASEEA